MKNTKNTVTKTDCKEASEPRRSHFRFQDNAYEQAEGLDEDMFLRLKTCVVEKAGEPEHWPKKQYL